MISSYDVPDQKFKKVIEMVDRICESTVLGNFQGIATQDYNSKNKQKKGHVSSLEKKGRGTTVFCVISWRT